MKTMKEKVCRQNKIDKLRNLKRKKNQFIFTIFWNKFKICVWNTSKRL